MRDRDLSDLRVLEHLLLIREDGSHEAELSAPIGWEEHSYCKWESRE